VLGGDSVCLRSLVEPGAEPYLGNIRDGKCFRDRDFLATKPRSGAKSLPFDGFLPAEIIPSIQRGRGS
jgi:hypothetical protein